MHALRHSRRFAAPAALAVLVLAVQPVASALHTSGTDHAWCAAHGHLVHASEALDALPVAETPRQTVAARDQGEHVHDECATGLALRDGGLPERHDEDRVPAHGTPSAVTGAGPRGAVGVLALAPKQGPPAA